MQLNKRFKRKNYSWLFSFLTHFSQLLFTAKLALAVSQYGSNMNEELDNKSRIALIIGLAGILSIFLCFSLGYPTLFWIGFIMLFVGWIIPTSMRFCDFCGKRLEYVRQQYKYSDLYSCKTCEHKIRIGKLSLDNPEYKNLMNENRGKTANK